MKFERFLFRETEKYIRRKICVTIIISNSLFERLSVYACVYGNTYSDVDCLNLTFGTHILRFDLQIPLRGIRLADKQPLP